MVLERQQRAEAEILEALRFASGLHVEHDGDRVRLGTAAHTHHELDLIWVPKLREAEIGDLVELARIHTRPCLFLTRSLDKGALRCAAALDLNIADLRSIHIDLPGLFVHIEGSPAPPEPDPHPLQSGMLRGVFALLHSAHPPNHHSVLAATAGLSVPELERELEAMSERGWIVAGDEEIRILDQAAMLRAWTRGYAEDLRPQLLLVEAVPGGTDFRTWREELLARQPPDVLVGGALGAAWFGGDIVPDTATLHVPALTASILRDCRVLPMPGGPIALLGRLGTADAAVSMAGLAHPLLILGELSANLDPRIQTLRESLGAAFVRS